MEDTRPLLERLPIDLSRARIGFTTTSGILSRFKSIVFLLDELPFRTEFEFFRRVPRLIICDTESCCVGPVGLLLVT